MNRRMMMVNISESLLPKEFKQVKFIQSDGDQQIRIPFGIENNDVIFCDVQVLSFSYGSGYQAIYGTYLSQYFMLCANPNINYWTTQASYQNYVQSTVLKSTERTTFEWNISSKTIKINGITASASQKTITVDPPLGIFGVNNGNAIARKTQMKLYDFNIKRGGVEITHLIPCYRRSDGKVGVYDIVNNIFYTNIQEGVGDFTIGGNQ